MKATCKLWLCYALYMVLALAPAAIAVALDWQAFTGTPQRIFSLSVSGMVAVTLVVLQALGHAPKPMRRIVWYALFAGLLWVLRPIVQSLAALLTAMTVGELVAMLVAGPLIKLCKRRINKEDLALAIQEGLKDTSDGKGRV